MMAEISSPTKKNDVNGSATEFFCENITSLEVNQVVHYAACEQKQKLHKFCNVSLWIASSVALAFAFVDVRNFWEYSSYALGVITLFATIISGIQVFADFSSAAKEHQSAAIGYGKLLRFARSRTSGGFSEVENKKEIEQFLEEWRIVSSGSPLTTKKQRSLFEK